MEMKPFFIEDEFIPNLPSLFWYLDIDSPEELKDDWSLEVSECDKEPVVQLSAEWIVEQMDEERFDEDGLVWNKIETLLNEQIDFKKINELIPKLWHMTGRGITITKQDLIKWNSN